MGEWLEWARSCAKVREFWRDGRGHNYWRAFREGHAHVIVKDTAAKATQRSKPKEIAHLANGTPVEVISYVVFPPDEAFYDRDGILLMTGPDRTNQANKYEIQF